MYINDEALLKPQQEENAAKRDSDEFESSCRRIPFGSLNAFDVVRLWARDEEGRTAKVGQRAREIVTEHALPLLELSPGQWIVRHIN